MNTRHMQIGLWSGAVAIATLINLLATSAAGAAEKPYAIGVAKVDITPAYPIRLNGFGFRRTESEGITQRIWAKALAIGADEDRPVVLIAIDSLGIRQPMVDEVARRLKKQAGIERDRVAVTFSHSHTTPKVNGAADTIFSSPIPAEHQAHIDRYTSELTDALEAVALKALADRRPATLHRAVGKVGFAKNRRTEGGPVDHDLPILVVKSADDGAIRAIYVSYACHCVTLSDNKVSGDWSGFAQEAIERNHAAAVALASIGCGSDSNPDSGVTGANTAVAADQGAQIADEVERLLQMPLTPVAGPIETKLANIELPLNPPPSRDALSAMAAKNDPAGYNAQFQLGKLDRGEKLLTSLDYPVQTWTFGDNLAIVFLGGEVCVDYSLRLKKEFDASRLWTNGYSNDFGAYIPSERLLKEGGYGGGAEIVFFALPNTLAPGLEERIVTEVHRQLPQSFAAKSSPRQSHAQPWPLEEAVASIKVKEGFVVEVAAAEPLIADPVAIDFAPDGRMWVADMTDYSRYPYEEFEATGSVRLLTDADGDGRFDASTEFCGGLRFPTDVKAWGNGVIVCDAPDVIYLEDSDGDGKADVRKVLLTGFETQNTQARVNSLRWGLDNWVYGSCGIFGGTIKTPGGSVVELGGRDFRFRPDSDDLEPVTGRTQQGRACDDWGNWFGCENSTLLVHYPLDDHYLSRNAHIAPPATEVFVPTGEDPQKLHPIGEPSLFVLSGPPGRPTSACGLEIYRDDLLGPEYANNAFVAEPVNNLVHRFTLSARGATFAGSRSADETDREFLASTDPWFRPVQVRTGTDGCLYVVDMHRAVIEHQDFIPEEVVSKLDLMAGREQGRILRVRPVAAAARSLARIDQLNGPALAAALDCPNGPQRDAVQQRIVDRRMTALAPALKALVEGASRPAVRLQALCTLGGLKSLDAELLVAALDDRDPSVRRHAIRLSEAQLAGSPALVDALLKLQADTDPQVLLQLAYTLGSLDDPRAATALVRLATASRDDPYILAGVWSSVNDTNVGPLVRQLLAADGQRELPPSLLTPAIRLIVDLGTADDVTQAASAIAADARNGDAIATWRLEAGALLIETARGKAALVAKLSKSLAPLAAAAQRQLSDGKADERQQLAALRMLVASGYKADLLLPLVGGLLEPKNSPVVQKAAVAMAASIGDPRVGEALLASWQGYSPAVRAEVFDVLMGRKELAAQLLDRAATGGASAADLDALQRQRLLTHPAPEIRAQAQAVLAGTIDADRDRLVKQYVAAVGQRGEADKGHPLFTKYCSGCHRLNGEGHDVGPDLAALTSLNRAGLIESILDPNRAVDERYRSYTALTSEGLAHAGVLVSETSTSVTLLEQEGKHQTLLRADLDAFQNSGKSLMPEGLERDLSPDDVANLTAYLTASGQEAKRIDGNAPALVSADYDGTLWMLAANAEIFGDDITFESPFQNIGYWHGENDYAAWRVETEQSREYSVFLHLACAEESAGNRFVILGGETPLKGQVSPTGGYDNYLRQFVGRIILPAGQSRIVVRPDGPLTSPNLMDLHGLYLVPSELNADRAIADRPPGDARDAATEIGRMLIGLEVGKPGEYDRIPAIWKEAIAAGKRNDKNEVARLLDLSMPRADQPLADWQAVVLGGGVINGISQQDVWPRRRITEILQRYPDRRPIWERTIELASEMADNPKVRTGTRYDALRILGADSWERHGEQIARYLAAGTDAELQMGAISGLSDIESDDVAPAIIGAFSGFNEENRRLAVAALLRTPERARALSEAIASGAISREALTADELEKLSQAAKPKPSQ